jgi:hypothetical protein
MTDLGFDTGIKRIGDNDFDLQFNIEETKYNTSLLLYDIGADAPCGRGTWVFEVKDQETGEVRVVKDCWVENRKGKRMEHEIVAGIKETVNSDDFLKHFVEICGHRRTDTSGGFKTICNILTKGEFEPLQHFKPQPLILAHTNSRRIYSEPTRNSAPNHGSRSQQSPPPTQKAPVVPPYPRFRYQVVYSERGMSLFEVTSLKEVFHHLEEITIGMRQGSVNQDTRLRLNPALKLLHEAGWVHRDLSPGNIIVVDGKAKISDLEFAKRRVVQELEGLTRQTNQSVPVVKDSRTVSLPFDMSCELY